MGTIIYRKERKKYVAKLEGRQGEKRSFATREKANAWVRQKEAAVENRTYIRTGVAPLFAQGAEDYLDDQRDEALQLGTISNAALKNKIRYIKTLSQLPYGDECLGDIPVNDLHAIGLKGCRKHLLEKLKYSPKTVREIWNCLGQAFEFWVVNNWAVTNHARLVKLPKVQRNKKPWRLSMERAALIVASAPSDFRLAIKFAMITGLRTSEQRALTWQQIDLDQRTVLVDRAIDSEGKLKEAKTEAGMRLVTLTPTIIADLRAWRLAQPIAQRRNDLVFPQADGRIANAGQYYLLGLTKALKAAGIEDHITWHQLRHYYASALIFQTQTPAETVSRLMARLLQTSGDYDRALANAERAYQLNPCHSDMVASYGMSLVWCGRAREGLEHLERAFAINPYAPAIYKSYLSIVYFFAGRPQDGLDILSSVQGTVGPSRFMRIANLVALDRLTDARAEAGSACQDDPSFDLASLLAGSPFKRPEDRALLGHTLQRAGLGE